MSLYSSHLNFRLPCKFASLQSCTSCTLPRLALLRLAENPIAVSILFLCLLTLSAVLHADTIDNYMNIANRIPQMEIKADMQAQAWARSAHHVLTITSESIAETLIEANEVASNQGKPIFCLPQGIALNSVLLNELIQQTYNEISSQQSDKDKMTVSQIAWVGVSKRYPCQAK